jgi:hypothetical protein
MWKSSGKSGPKVGWWGNDRTLNDIVGTSRLFLSNPHNYMLVFFKNFK